MSYTREQFMRSVLAAIGNRQPDQRVVDWMVAWSMFETAWPLSASYNLLNTTQAAPGATNFNAVGVKNYTSYAQGVEATAQTLGNGFYPQLLRALQTNNVDALGMVPGGSVAPAIVQEVATWGTGHATQFPALAMSPAITTDRAQAFDGTWQPVAAGAAAAGAPGSLADLASSGGGGSGGGGSSTTLMATIQAPAVLLAPNTGVVAAFSALDALFVLRNPLDLPPGAAADPVGMLLTVMANVGVDAVALLLRLMLLIVSLALFAQIIRQFVNADQLYQGASQAALSGLPLLLEGGSS